VQDSQTGAILRSQNSFDGRVPTSIGVVFSGGAAWKKGRIGLMPEFRYTRGGLQSVPSKNRPEILLSVRF